MFFSVQVISGRLYEQIDEKSILYVPFVIFNVLNTFNAGWRLGFSYLVLVIEFSISY